METNKYQGGELGDGWALYPADVVKGRQFHLVCGQTLKAVLSADDAADLARGINRALHDAVAEQRSYKDGAYAERNQLVAALSKLFPAGQKATAIEGWDPAWHNCVYIDLPTGQVSWHIHESEMGQFAHLSPYAGEWDGHDTPEKYRRLAALQPVPADPRISELEAALRAARATIVTINEDMGYDEDDMLHDETLQQIDAALAGSAAQTAGTPPQEAV